MATLFRWDERAYKFLVWNYLWIPCTKNYWNRFIWHRVIQNAWRCSKYAERVMETLKVGVWVALVSNRWHWVLCVYALCAVTTSTRRGRRLAIAICSSCFVTICFTKWATMVDRGLTWRMSSIASTRWFAAWISASHLYTHSSCSHSCWLQSLATQDFHFCTRSPPGTKSDIGQNIRIPVRSTNCIV